MKQNVAVNLSRPRLSGKLFWMAIAFLAVALTAVGFTLYESWKLEGGAAVINDMGSERMRSYRIAYLLADGQRNAGARVIADHRVRAEGDEDDRRRLDRTSQCCGDQGRHYAELFELHHLSSIKIVGLNTLNDAAHCRQTV